MEKSQKIQLNSASELMALNEAVFNGTSIEDDAFIAGRSSFFNYTRFENVKKMLSPKFGDYNYFYASQIEDMNDKDEEKLHEKDKCSVYILCFSNIWAENLPLWFLYGGIDGRGARVGFRPTTMKDFLESIEFVYPVVDNVPEEKNPLIRHKDYKIEMGWVYYTDYAGNIVHRGKTYSLSDEEYKKFNNENNYFVKRLAWKYEEEFRIVIHLLDPELAKKYNRVAIRFKRKGYMNQRGLRVGFAPNYQQDGEESEYDRARKELKDETGVILSVMEPSHLNVNYNLLNLNKQIIVDNIESILMEFEDSGQRKSAIKAIGSVLKKFSKNK